MKNIDELLLAIKAFHEVDIKFVLIGGLAMIAHGADTLTQDIAIAYMIETSNLEKLSAFLATIHPRVLAPSGRNVLDYAGYPAKSSVSKSRI